MVTVAFLDPLIAERTLLKHPFYVRWSKGELTLDDLRVYAKEYYHLVCRVPAVLESILTHDSLEDGLRAQIEHNLAEEREHIALWEGFARSLGISEMELRSYQPSAKAQSAVALLEKAAQGDLEAGIAAMYALEAELPRIAETKSAGLIQFYGLTSRDAQAYFDEHRAEEKHLVVWRKVPVNESVAVPAATESLKAQHLLLDAVCDLQGIPLSC